MSSFTPRTAEVPIFQGGDESRIRQLEAAARAARDEADDDVQTLMETPAWREIAEEHDAVVTEALERAVNVALVALDRKKWRKMIADHPPREGHAGDKAVGVNEEEFADELVPASVLKMQPEPDEGRAAFLDSLSDAQFESLYLTAFTLNRGHRAAPKAGLLSELSRSSSES